RTSRRPPVSSSLPYPTLFRSISRGLAPSGRVATFGMRSLRGLRSAARVARTHFSGNVRGWLDIDRDVVEEVVRRVRDERPDFVLDRKSTRLNSSHTRISYAVS